VKFRLAAIATLNLPLAALHASPRLDILLFTSEDMNHDSVRLFAAPARCGISRLVSACRAIFR
jgi:hypothetical protein